MIRESHRRLSVSRQHVAVTPPTSACLLFQDPCYGFKFDKVEKTPLGYLWFIMQLKALDTFDKCRRTDLFSLGVSENMHQIANVWKFWLNLSSNLQENIKRNTLFLLCFQMLYKRLQLKSFIIRVRNDLFLKNYVTSEGAVSHNVTVNFSYYQVRCYANN